jgi:hypothetical protein
MTRWLFNRECACRQEAAPSRCELPRGYPGSSLPYPTDRGEGGDAAGDNAQPKQFNGKQLRTQPSHDASASVTKAQSSRSSPSSGSSEGAAPPQAASNGTADSTQLKPAEQAQGSTTGLPAQDLAHIWRACAVLHCTYCVAPCGEGTLVSIAWSDSCGELLQQTVTQVCSTQRRDGVAVDGACHTPAWDVALCVLARTAKLLDECNGGAADKMTHVCVALGTHMAEHAWVWAQLPILLEVAAGHGVAWPVAAQHVTAIFVAAGKGCDPASARQVRC